MGLKCYVSVVDWDWDQQVPIGGLKELRVVHEARDPRLPPIPL